MNHQEYVLSVIKKKYSITKPPVRAILNHDLTKTKHRGLYIEFKQKKNRLSKDYKLFINDNVGNRMFHNAPSILSDPKITNCLWFKEHYDEIRFLKGLYI